MGYPFFVVLLFVNLSNEVERIRFIMTETRKWKQSFLIVALGQAVSLLGSHGVQFALIWWLAEQTASPLMLGASGLAAYLPMTLLSPVAGIAADRFNRKFICIFSDLAMGFCALMYAVLLCWFDLPVWTVFFLLCTRGAGSAFQQPAIQSILPQLVPAEELVRTNGWMQLITAGSFLSGPLIGAALYAAFPLPVVLMSDVVGAGLASLALAAVKIPRLEKRQRGQKSAAAQFREGLQVFREDSRLFRLVLAQALCMFFYGPLSSFYPLMTSNYFNLPALYGGAAELSFAAGMILSSLLFSSVWKVRRNIGVSYAGLFGMGFGAALCGVLPPCYGGWFVFALGCALLGAAGNVHLVPLTAYIQKSVAPEKMGRAFSVLTLISSVTMPVGLLISSPIAETAGVAVWFLLSGIAIMALAAVVFLLDSWKERRKKV